MDLSVSEVNMAGKSKNESGDSNVGSNDEHIRKKDDECYEFNIDRENVNACSNKRTLGNDENTEKQKKTRFSESHKDKPTTLNENNSVNDDYARAGKIDYEYNFPSDCCNASSCGSCCEYPNGSLINLENASESGNIEEIKTETQLNNDSTRYDTHQNARDSLTSNNEATKLNIEDVSSHENSSSDQCEFYPKIEDNAIVESKHQSEVLRPNCSYIDDPEEEHDEQNSVEHTEEYEEEDEENSTEHIEENEEEYDSFSDSFKDEEEEHEPFFSSMRSAIELYREFIFSLLELILSYRQYVCTNRQWYENYMGNFWNDYYSNNNDNNDIAASTYLTDTFSLSDISTTCDFDMSFTDDSALSSYTNDENYDSYSNSENDN